jgi:hypothetical protein
MQWASRSVHTRLGARILRIHMGRVLEMAESSDDRFAYEKKIIERFGGQHELDLIRHQPCPHPQVLMREAANRGGLISLALDRRLDCEAVGNKLAAVELLQDLATGTTIFAFGGRRRYQFKASKSGPTFRTRHIAFFPSPLANQVAHP